MERRYSDAEARQLWNEKFTFFWYNEEELFHWTQNDFDEHARKLHETGTTAVMTFSVTHFRWTYLIYKDIILEALRKLVKACHKFNITVEEHHSSHLTYIVRSPEELAGLKSYFTLHDSNFDHFPGIMDAVTRHGTVNGKSMDEWVQIDGRTGKPAPTGYLGDAFCFNNPDYRKAYFDYVRELRATGIDSLLADDVQYFGDGNACTCAHCRRLFKAESGYDLPVPAHWGEFFDHFERPDFIAWRRFRNNSTARFQHDLTKLYRETGLAPYRVNYRSTLLSYDTTANTFSQCLEYWAQTFQENMLSAVIRYHWPLFFGEATMQHSVGERKNAPSMSLFYPTRYDQYYFAWALAESWGQLPFLCPEGGNLIDLDRKFNGFEAAHQELFREVHKLPDFAMLVSRSTLDLTDKSYYRTANPLRGFMQGAYLDHLSVTIVSEDEPEENFAKVPMIMAVGIRRVSADLLGKLTRFVQQGGKLVIAGAFAEFDTPDGVEALLHSPRVVQLPESVFPKDFLVGRVVSRMYGNTKCEPAYLECSADLREKCGKLVRRLLAKPAFVEDAPEMFLTTVFRTGRKANTLALHVVNVNNLLVPEGTMVSHDDLIDNFLPDAAPNAAPLTVTLNRTGIARCTLHTPEKDEAIAIPVTTEDGKTHLTVPAGTFAGYALLELSLHEVKK